MLADKYTVVGAIDSGATGTVYEVIHNVMERRVAAKVVASPTEAQQARFQKEARIISRLRHPNIVTVHDFGVTANELYLIMELVEGKNLRMLLMRGPIKPLSRALGIFRECVSAVAAAHLGGIVHGDLKPENLMLATDGKIEQLKVLDFGLADSSDAPSYSKQEHLVGTPQYMGPELWGHERATAKTDQYALGLILYELLTGIPAFRSDSITGYMSHHLSIEVPSVAGTKGPMRIANAIVHRMAAKDPAARYPDLHTVLKEIDDLLFSLGGDSIALRSENAAREPEPIWLLGAERAALREALGAGELRIAGEIADPSSSDASKLDEAYGIVTLPDQNWQRDWQQWCVPATRSPNLLALFAGESELAARAPLSQLPQAVVGAPDQRLLAAMLTAMSDPSVSTMGQYLSAGGHYLPLTSFHHKDASLGIIGEFLEAAGIRSSIRKRIHLICDELLLNAFAAVSSPDQRRPATNAPVSAGWVRWALQGSSLVVSVQDCSGTLLRDSVYRSLFEHHRRSLDDKRPGMGMGLGIIHQHSSAVLFQVVRDVMTEVTVVIPTKSSAVEGKRTLGWIWRDAATTVGSGSLGEGLAMQLVSAGGVDTLKVSGNVSEKSRLAPLFSIDRAVTLDLGGVDGINSNGVRLWIDAHRARSPSLRLTIRNCPREFLETLAAIGPLFLRPEEIASVLIPYVCPACGREEREAVEVAKLSEAIKTSEAPPCTCASCGRAMEFDGIPQVFFNGLRKKAS